MKRSLRIALAVVLVPALGWTVWLLANSNRAKEPLYHGKPLSEWLQAFAPGKRDCPDLSARDARRAVQEAGTNAIPTLVRMIGATDSPMKLKLLALAGKQHFIQVHWSPAANLHQEAESAFQILGRRARVAVPDLVRLYGQQPPAGSQREIISALGAIDPAAKAALPSQMRDAVSPNVSLQYAITNALVSIGGATSVPGLFIPPGLQLDDDRQNQAETLLRLCDGSFGYMPNRETAVPILLALLKRPEHCSYWVKFALERLDPDLAAQVLTQDYQAAGRDGRNDRPAVERSRVNTGRAVGGAPFAVGEWSAAVKDGKYHRLRGRLFVWGETQMGNRRQPWWRNARVYLELQDVTGVSFPRPAEVCFDAQVGLDLELRDAQGNAAGPTPPAAHGPVLPGSWTTVPFDGTIRLRVDLATSSRSEGDGLVLVLASGAWRIPAGDTNVYFLSGTFHPPTNHVSVLDYDPWGGTLQLPAVKLSLRNP